MICVNKKMISLIDVQKIFISDLNGSGTIVSEMVKCGANLVLEWKVDLSEKFAHRPTQEIWSQNVQVVSYILLKGEVINSTSPFLHR